MEKIPTLEELIDAYEKEKIPGDEGKFYICYLTSGHKESEKPGWIADSEFKGYVKLRKALDDNMRKLMWGDLKNDTNGK